MLIKRIDRLFSIKSIQEGIRKLGVNLFTAGIAAIFIGHITELTLWIVVASACVMMMGIAGIMLGTLRNLSNESE
jgi:hypothetical protein